MNKDVIVNLWIFMKIYATWHTPNILIPVIRRSPCTAWPKTKESEINKKYFDKVTSNRTYSYDLDKLSFIELPKTLGIYVINLGKKYKKTNSNWHICKSNRISFFTILKNKKTFWWRLEAWKMRIETINMLWISNAIWKIGKFVETLFVCYPSTIKLSTVVWSIDK